MLVCVFVCVLVCVFCVCFCVRVFVGVFVFLNQRSKIIKSVEFPEQFSFGKRRDRGNVFRLLCVILSFLLNLRRLLVSLPHYIAYYIIILLYYYTIIYYLKSVY